MLLLNIASTHALPQSLRVASSIANFGGGPVHVADTVVVRQCLIDDDKFDDPNVMDEKMTKYKGLGTRALNQ